LGKILPFLAKFFSIGQLFFKKKSPNDLSEILAKKLFGRLFGSILWSLGDFFTKTSCHPVFVNTFIQSHTFVESL
jgi:hypothetical protein